eukprot:TRINITY_DN2841_c0_g1_i4.p1 TRINITY_DN2841_c0_g1~~TRINITY_DN2841_c0_g1_i4.p1  ORF type:complete len:1289 (+),score=439.06 TRINITY_DN2841_c0_g1_i4:651-4517(+)
MSEISGIPVAGTSSGVSYTNWDADHSYGCACDLGYFGVDCEYSICPMGSDPITTNQHARAIKMTIGSTGSIGSGNIVFGMAGSTISFPAHGSSVNAARCEELIKSLDSVSDAKCIKSDSVDGNGGTHYWITFTEWSTVAIVNNIRWHDGNPDITEFICDTTDVPNATCTLEDVDKSITVGGTYTGSDDAYFIIEIQDADTGTELSFNHKYKWRRKTGLWNEDNSLTSGAVTLSDGLTATIASDWGYAIGTQWRVDGVTDKSEVTAFTLDSGATATDFEERYLIFTAADGTTTHCFVFRNVATAAAIVGCDNLTEVTGLSASDVDTHASTMCTSIDTYVAFGMSCSVSSNILTVTTDATGVFVDATLGGTSVASFITLSVTTEGCAASQSAALLSTASDYEVCSGRGVCDFTTGTCQCFDGFYGLSCNTEYAAASVADTSVGHTVSIVDTSYAGTVMHLSAVKGPADDFNFIYAQADSSDIFKIGGSGKMWVRDNAFFNAALDVDNAITALSLHVRTDGALIENGGLLVEKGLFQAEEGAKITDLGMDVENSVDEDTVLLYAEYTSFTKDVLALKTSKAANSDFNLITVRTGVNDDATIYSERFKMDGYGSVTMDSAAASTPAFKIEATHASFLNAAVLNVESTRATNSAFDLIKFVTDADGTPQTLFLLTGEGVIDAEVTASGTNAIDILASDAAYTGTILKLETATDVGTGFNMVEIVGTALAVDSSLFTIRGDGKTTIHQGGLDVTDGALIRDGCTVTTENVVVKTGLLLVESEGGLVKDGLYVDGESHIASTSTTSAALNVYAGAAAFTDTVMKVSSAKAPATDFKLVELQGRDAPSVIVEGSTDAALTINIRIASSTTFEADLGSGYGAALTIAVVQTSIGSDMFVRFSSVEGWQTGSIYQFLVSTAAGGSITLNSISNILSPVPVFTVYGNGNIEQTVVDDTDSNVVSKFQRCKNDGSDGCADVVDGDIVTDFKFQGYYSGFKDVGEIVTTAKVAADIGGQIDIKVSDAGTLQTVMTLAEDSTATFYKDLNVDGSTVLGDAGSTTTLQVNSIIQQTLKFENTNTFKTILTVGDPSADITINFPETLEGATANVITTGNLEEITKFGVVDTHNPIHTDSTIKADDTITALEFIETSDERFKTDITPLRGALDIIRDLEGVRFNWKSNEERKSIIANDMICPEPSASTANTTNDDSLIPEEIGFIAQQVEKIVPELVHTNAETGQKGVSYSKTSALLVEAIKEHEANMMADIFGMESELEQLEEQSTRQEQMLSQLEAMMKSLTQ